MIQLVNGKFRRKRNLTTAYRCAFEVMARRDINASLNTDRLIPRMASSQPTTDNGKDAGRYLIKWRNGTWPADFDHKPVKARRFAIIEHRRGMACYLLFYGAAI